MSGKTTIEWTDKSWNPIAGCSLVSPGCTNCYAMKQAQRIQHMTGPDSHYFGTTRVIKGAAVWTGTVNVAPDSIFLAPLKWKKPCRIFVNSMSDLFHESVRTEIIDRVFAIMALCPQHTFQVLTKRPERMRAYLSSPGTPERIYDLVCDMAVEEVASVILTTPFARSPTGYLGRQRVLLGQWPLPNVWLGVSVEDQVRADERIPILLETPAAIRWISAEPLLGALHLGYLGWPNVDVGSCRTGLSALTGHRYVDGKYVGSFPSIDWVVVGGESGTGARPMYPDHARRLRDQCIAAGVPFLFKQWGSHSLHEIAEGGAVTPPIPADAFRWPMLRWQDNRFIAVPRNASAREAFTPGLIAFPTGKKEAGRLLDGVKWDQYPEVRA